MSARSISKASLDARFSRQRALAAIGGSVPIVNPNLAQPAWFVDPANVTGHASDGNLGTSALAPLRTFAGLFNRLGSDQPQWDASALPPSANLTVTVTQMSDQTIGADAYLLTPRLLNGCNLAWVAQMPQRGSGTFSPTTVTSAVKTSAGTRLRLNGNLPAGTQKGDTIVNVSKSSFAIVQAVAGGNATMGQPILEAGRSQPGNCFGYPHEDNTWSAADHYQVYRPLLSDLELVESFGGTIDASANNGMLFLSGFHFTDNSSSNSSLSFIATGGIITTEKCWVDSGFISVYALNGNVNQFVAGLVESQVFLTGFAEFLAGVCTGTLQAIGMQNIVDVDSWAQNITVTGADNFAVNVGFAATFLVTVGGSVRFQKVFGGGASIWGPGTINVEKGGEFYDATGDAAFSDIHVVALELDGAGTGTSYAAGVWTDGVAVTVLNLAANHGLQNPRTGARYSDGV